ncbi:MAG: TolC family protein [Pseudomonadota bacterium]
MLSLLLAGCTTLGPDYQEPEVAWLGDWQTDLYGQIADTEQQTSQDLSFWWRLFDDPVLNRLIETAHQENLSLRIAGLRILESRAALGIADSTRWPQLQQIGGGVSGVHTSQHGGIAEDRSQSLTAYQSEFRVGWELDFWGRFRRSIEAADALFLSSITAYHDLQVLLSAQVADLYFTYRTLQQRIRIARMNAARQQRSFAITEKLFRAGQGSELDFQQANTQYLATLATIPDFEAALIRTRNALALLLGQPPHALIPLGVQTYNPDKSTDGLPQVSPLRLQAMPARLLLRRPDIRTAAWQVAGQSAQIGIARADYYPAISLLGSIGWSGDSLSATPDTSRFVAGPGISWNIFDYGRIRNNVRLQDARLQQRIEAFQNSVLAAAREIDDAAIGVLKTAEQEAVLERSVAAAERSLELANTRYREGYADFQRVLDAQRALLSQADRHLVVRNANLSAVVQMYKALGGGWTSNEGVVPAATQQQMQERTDWGELLEQPLPLTD